MLHGSRLRLRTSWLRVAGWCSFLLLPWQGYAAVKAAPPVLRVLAPRLLILELGKEIQAAFQQEQGCKLELIPLQGIHQLKVTLQQNPKVADVVLGLFYENFADAALRKQFVSLPALPAHHRLPQPWLDQQFWPVCYGKLALVYDSRRLAQPPTSFEALIKGQKKVILMDPRTSDMGLGLLCWVQRVYGKKAGDFWRRLKPCVRTFAQRWSSGYALFLRGEADFALAYTTSPAYHRLMEKNPHMRAAVFEEGHYPTYWVGGILKTTAQPQLAQALLDLLLTPALQRHFVYKDWSLPVVALQEPLPQEFLVPHKTLPGYAPQEVAAHKQTWLRTWRNALA